MIAILSDIHGNLPALRAVLADMPPVAEIWVLGDLIGELPFPCEVLDCLLALRGEAPVFTISGNREASLLQARAGQHDDWWHGTQMRALAWTVDQLTPRHWDFLAGLLHPFARLNGRALLVHGAPQLQRGLAHSARQVEAATAELPYALYCAGHTHQARRYALPGRTWINAGAVGMSLDGVAGIATYALLDETVEGYPSVFRHVSYDVDETVRALEASPLWMLAPGIARATALEVQTGRHHIQSLLVFARAYAEARIGGPVDNIPPDLWAEAEQAWDGAEWLEGRYQDQGGFI